MTPQHVSNLDDDVVFVEPGEHIRTLVGTVGSLTIEGVQDAEGRGRRFECRIAKITASGIALVTPATSPVGGWIAVHFEQLGKFNGPVIQVLDGVLIMLVVCSSEQRARLSSTLEWISSGRPDVRRSPRLIPENPASVLALSPGQGMPCQVIDYSIGGAAVQADAAPALGAVVKIGRVVGCVVRHFAGGFAVAFPVVQDPRTVERLLLQPSGAVAPN